MNGMSPSPDDPIPAPGRRRFMSGGTRHPLFGRVVLVATLVVWLPALACITSMVVGDFAGCQLSEAGVRPCMIAGIDVGGPLAVMFVMGWLAIALVPFMAVTLILSVIVIGVAVWRRVRQRVRPRQTPP